jgi:tetratricopeptide (TPR) repeat protein
MNIRDRAEKANRRDAAASPLARKGGQEGSPAVRAVVEELVLPTYLPALPDKNPMFLEKRVYQGSSGKVYPLPFIDRIAEKPAPRAWKGVWIENQFVRVLVLPELGGRIHAFQDKSNGYDLIYYQPVIKPALVGLTGPWISGGIEFNWPQHHRPATFLPVDFQIEDHADGSKTIWCGDHDPLCRMKGMHGICLHPDKAYLELKVRVFNRTPVTQTFLWWANVATRVHEAYQSFFPPDVYYVADHARRATSQYPLAEGFYYGVNYGERGRTGVPAGEIPRQFVPPHCEGAEAAGLNRQTPRYAPNDLSFYANIPTPCSYMCMGSTQDFFGGYDFKRQAGLVHIANHHISPGKKQWTWGNHEFGYAWDRNLTDADEQGEYGPYIELMAGVYTDNQPDFSFLQPGESRTWSQYWYPIQGIGPALYANLEAAVSVKADARRLRVGVSVTRRQSDATILLRSGGREIARRTADLSPSAPFVEDIELGAAGRGSLTIQVLDADNRELVHYDVQPRRQGKVPPAATEPLPPAEISSNDELFLTGVHLEQYRHVTRAPELYWREALRRDPLDSRCNNAMGRWHFKRGEFADAERYFRRAIERLTRRNANPADGEAFYNLGLCLRHRGRDDDAYALLYKATWNQAWASAAYHRLAEIDSTKRNWNAALDHIDRALRLNSDNLNARSLKALVLRRLGRAAEAAVLLEESARLDRLDVWTHHLAGKKLTSDLQARLDVAHNYASAGFLAEAIALLKSAAFAPGDLPDQSWGARPLVLYTLAWLQGRAGQDGAAHESLARAAAAEPDYCFPARLEEIAVLESAMRANPRDARAPYYLGNLLYHRCRHEEAIRLWERGAKLDAGFSVVWRNLGIGYFNILRQPRRARLAYERALRANPADARLVFERDQLWKRLGEQPERRLRELEKHLPLVRSRDDLSLELCALYNQTSQPEKALTILRERRFQPWEGGEGGPLGQYTRAHVALGRRALEAGDAQVAREHFEAALTAPENLGEARHLLANQSDVRYWLGCALAAAGETQSAREHWTAAATFKGDFQEMSVRSFSEMTYYSAAAWTKLGRRAKAGALLRGLLRYARELERAPARVDYFATSLPTMLLFEDDLHKRQKTTALFLQAQARLGLGQAGPAEALLKRVLARDANHPLARDFLGPAK